MANIVPIAPKQEKERYRSVVITYLFNPSTSLWGYKFTHTQEFAIHGRAKGLAEAKREAHNRIDKLRGP